MDTYLYEINLNLKSHFKTYFKNETMKHICDYCLNFGKRIRPSISMDICKSLRGNVECVKYASLISEYLHTSSLLIDDLPCMDNALIRRGQPSSHIKFGEAVTQIASVIFVSLGFDCVQIGYSMYPDQTKIGDISKIIMEHITKIIGSEGIAGGQLMDLTFDKKEVESLFLETKETFELDEMIQKKTGALFELSFLIGWIFGGGDLQKLNDVKELSKTFSFIYQLVDDYEDKDDDVKEKNYYLMHGKDKFHNDLHNSLITFKAQLQTLELESTYFITVINYLQEKLSK
jgi:geranylgeranyl diphosphate synthase type II